MPRVCEVGNLKVAPGEFGSGYLPGVQLPDSTYLNIPIMLLNGQNDGPTICLVSAIHGPEIANVEVFRQIMREKVPARDLNGIVVAIPVANPLAYVNHTYFTPSNYDSANPVTLFPGEKEGGITSRIVHRLAEVVLQSDFFIDAHCTSNDSLSYTIVDLAFGNEETKSVAYKMAKSFGLTMITEPFLRGSEQERYTSLQFSMSHNIPGIIYEINNWRTWHQEAVSTAVTGMLNVMKTLKMIRGDVQKQSTQVLDGLFEAKSVKCDHGGILSMDARPGDKVKRGQTFSRVLDPFGNEIEHVTSPIDGHLIEYNLLNGQAVCTGDLVAEIGQRIPAPYKE